MTKGYNNNPIDNTRHVRDQLSDYMDGLLAGDAREAVLSHLEDCPECRADYIELRATQKLMQSMPTMAAPRAFTLTPEMAGQIRKPSFWERFLTPANSPRLATGSVVAFMLLFLFMAGNFAGNFSASPVSQSFSKIGSGLSGDSADTYSSQEAAPSAKQSSTDLAMAAPTVTTAAMAPAPAEYPSTGGDMSGATAPGVAEPTARAEAMPSQSQPAGSGSQTATDPSSAPDVVQPPAPNTVVTPNTDVSNSGTSSPTTTFFDNSTPSTDGTSSYLYAQPVDPNQPANTPTNNGNTLWAVLQIALLGFALALGAAAFIARRGV